MSLVQIRKVKGEIERVPRGETPIIELHLDDHQYVTDVKLEASVLSTTSSGLERKTVDWDWTAYVVTVLP